VQLIRFAIVFVAVSALVSPVMAQSTTASPSVAEQALGAEVMECVRSRVALRAEVIGLKAAQAVPTATEAHPAAEPTK
jgi:hypothetical protein